MTIRGLLLDLDGVLYIGGRAVEGACEAIDYLCRNNYPFRCVSNTTRKSRATISRQLSGMGFAIPEEYIFTPPRAAISYMKETGKDRYRLLTTGDSDRDFAGFGAQNPAGTPDYIILGDAGDKITYARLNDAFRAMMEGAELIALEKDRYWMAADGLALSAGPFAAALEFATGKQAVVVGKPSQAFFGLALRDMGLAPGEAAMIGDDIFTDVDGAQQAGMTGILVRTGKFREETVRASGITPDRIIGSIADIRELL